MTKCPGFGDLQLATIHKDRHGKWLKSVSPDHKHQLGFKISDDEKEAIRARQRAYISNTEDRPKK